MNRKTIFAMTNVIACVVFIAPSQAGVMPDITGRTFIDSNLNGSHDSGEALEGAMIRLYQDDGDGILEPGVDDPEVSIVYTGADGSYRFDQLSESRYFVQQPSQVIAGTNLPESFSGIIEPFRPELVIDRFETAGAVFADPLVPAATASNIISGSEVLGSERDLSISWSSGRGRAKLRVSAYDNSLLQYDTAPGVVAKAVVTWDGVDGDSSPIPGLGLNGLDLTNDGSNDGLIFKMGVDQPGAGDSVMIRIFQGDSFTYSEALVELPVTDGTASAFTTLPFSAFNGTVTADNIDAIQLILGDSNQSIDAQIDLVGVYGNNVHNFVAVPEPGAIVLLLLGFGCVFTRCRRRI